MKLVLHNHTMHIARVMCWMSNG